MRDASGSMRRRALGLVLPMWINSIFTASDSSARRHSSRCRPRGCARVSRILLPAAPANRPRRVAGDDMPWFHGTRYYGTGANDRSIAYGRHHDRPRANPDVITDGYSGSRGRLMANRRLQIAEFVCMPSAQKLTKTGHQHVIAKIDKTDLAIAAERDLFTNRYIGVIQYRAKAELCALTAFFQCIAVKARANLQAEISRDDADRFRHALKEAVIGTHSVS